MWPLLFTVVSRNLRVAGALTAGVLLAGLAAPASVSARVVLDSTLLGMSEAIVFQERADEVGFPIPVPAGLSPRLLTGTVQTPVDLQSGHLEAWSGNLLLARVPLDGAEDFVRVELPLDKATVRDGEADVTLRTVLTSRGEACPDWTDRSLELLDSEVVYDGEPERPQVLADFLPPVLERLEIYLPDPPSRVEVQAATELATSASFEYGRRGMEIEVLSLDAGRPATASPFTRRVEVREAGETRVDLVEDSVPTVSITGDPDSLATQARVVSTGLGTLAVADAVTLEGPLPAARALLTRATLDELDIGSVSARGLGSVTARFGVDQTEIGAVTGDVTLSLQGMYTPPPSDRSGLVVVTADGVVLDSWVADQAGMIDRTVTIPAAAVNRYTDVAVTLQTAGAGAACGVLQPLTMLINGDTSIEIGQSSTPAPRGFESLPQALMPSLRVAASTDGLPDVARAITIVSTLQTLSRRPLHPEWVSVDELVSGRVPGVLVSSDGTPDGLTLPVELTGGRTFEVVDAPGEESASIRFYDDVDFASLQVVQDGDRAVLVASSTSGSGELDRTLDWLDGAPGRWGELRGNVLFTAPDRDPVALSTADPLGASSDDSAEGSSVSAALIVGGVAVVAGIALAGILWVATRGGRSGRRP